MTSTSSGGQGGLETSRKVALYVTMALAVLAGIAEIARQSESSPASWLTAVATFLDGALILSGVVMGLLFVLHLTRVRKENH